MWVDIVEGMFWLCVIAYLVSCIIFPIVLRSLYSSEALGVKVWWKFRTVNFLLEIVFRAAVIMLVWSLCQVHSKDSVELESRRVL